MDRIKDRPKTPWNVSQRSFRTSLQDDNNLLSPSRRSKRLQNGDLLENKKHDVLPVSKGISSENINNHTTTQIATSSEKSCCSINSQCVSSEHLFGLFDQEIDHSPGSNHKFYGCKRKGYPSPCSESFGLPDNPIFSNSPIFVDRTITAPLDINLADPWDISVLNLEHIDQPWLVENPEVITPYWDVESLFPFEVEDIRQKTEPECDLSKLSNSFDISGNILDISTESENDNVFTSTPIKNQNNSTLSVVSTISISNGEDTNVNIAELKDEVLKALEEAIKKKSTIGNIDMKIQIVTSDPKSPVTSPKKSSIELRINENVETESYKSTSSSKENYFVKNAREKSQKLNTKELSNIILSGLNDDWQDSPGSEVTDHSQNEFNSVQDSSAKKNKRLAKNRKKGVPGVRRSLRTKELNISTMGDKETLTCTPLSLKDSTIIPVSSSKPNKRLSKSKTLPNPLNNSSVSAQEIEIDLDLAGSKESKFKSKRNLRSSHIEVTENDKDISKNIRKFKIKESQPLQEKETFVGEQKEKDKTTAESLDSNQDTDGNRFSDGNEDSQSSQDECDVNESVGKERKKKARKKIRNQELRFGQEQSTFENTPVEKLRKRSWRFKNIDLQTSSNEVKIGDSLHILEGKLEQNTSSTTSSISTSQAMLQSSQNDMTMGVGNSKQSKILINNHTLSRHDESNTSKNKMEFEKIKHKDVHSSWMDISKNILENSVSETLHRQSDSNLNKSSSRQLTKEMSLNEEDLQSSQDESDVNKEDLVEVKRRRGRVKKAKAYDKLKNGLLNMKGDSINTYNTNTKSFGNKLDSVKDKVRDTLPTKRVLRPRPQPVKPVANDLKDGRRRTVSTSASETGPKERNYGFSGRIRSVSANFDNETAHTPIRRSLRSQVIEQTKTVSSIKSLEFTAIKDTPKVLQNMKSPKITFNLTNSFKETQKKFGTDSPIKSILKNVYDARGRLIGVKVHREKQLKMMPSALNIKPEDEDDTPSSKGGLKHPVVIPTALELDSIKKEEEEFLKERGITSRIKIVISPLEIKEEEDDTVGKTCPVLPLAVPKLNAPSTKKSGKISYVAFQDKTEEDKPEGILKSGIDHITPQKNNENGFESIVKSVELYNVTQEKAIENRFENTEKTKKNNGESNRISVSDSVSLAESKEVKIEEPDYNVGNFVWSQVGKYPYWPAIICYDPITQTFQKEVMKQNMAPKIYYHLRFFGDNGRRAWVNRKHIMLYCSNQDLEQIANKLKSENKNHNVVRPYLISGSGLIVEKWRRAVEELNLMKNKKYDAIIKYMLESYVHFLENRKKRRSYMLDASSESESEEPDVRDSKRRKKSNFFEGPLPVTADKQPIAADNALQTNTSQGFDEINISIGAQNIVVATAPLEYSSEKNSEVVNESLNQDDKHSRKGMQRTDDFNITTCHISDQAAEKISEISETLDKVTPRRSTRSLKPVETVHITAESLDPGLNTIPVENSEVSETSEPSNERRSLRGPKSSLSNEASSSQNIESEKVLNKLSRKQPDEGSEAESKTSNNSNMYSFENQMDLHKRNNLFNGLTKVRICDYCLKAGDLYKCKGKCGGFFHLDCASKVTQPRVGNRVKKRERSPNKAKVRNTGSAAPSIASTPKSNNSEEGRRTRNQCQVQIITIKSKHAIGTPKKVNLPDNFDELSLSEQIDYGMKEMMSKFENRTIYLDSTDSSSEEGSIIASKNKRLEFPDSPASSMAIGSEKSAAKSSDLDETVQEEKNSDDLEVSTLSENTKDSKLIKHVTADSIILTENELPMDITNLKCTYCRIELDPPCFACGLEISKRGTSSRRKCSQYRCGRYYHPYCLKMWPQTQWSIGKWSRNQEQEDSFTCPAHTCHTCFSEELGSAACRLPGDKLARCLLCPAGFHATTFCIPAGTEILGGSQLVCPRHRPKPTQPINTIWCFICSAGGNLICCDTCPTSVHPECQPISLTDDDKYICEDCESGRFPLYDEIVWVKLGQYRWWPAIVLFPNEIPENVRALKHQRGDFAVRFFGTNDHYWVNKARAFLFQEGDRGGSSGEANKSQKKVYETFGQAVEDAAVAYKLKKEFKLRREAESINSLRPPTYVKINKNKPVGNVKSLELDLSNATACECDPNKPHPCGPDSNCINRLLMTECDPDVCPAGIRCRNQSFQKRDYPPMIPYKTQGRGWGLKCLAPIQKGQFVIEYVGELIDSEEYQRRIHKMHQQKEENYYFMTVDSDRMIDAGPKGNISRFMNHCCNPNCVTQKWTVRGDTRVGLFAKCEIETGSELTFNYNLEVVGQEKKVCKCGASNCSGFIGVKVKSDKPQTDPVTEPLEPRGRRKYTKKRAVSPLLIPPCFMCGRKQSDLTCNNKFCTKGYHLKCLKLEEMPEVTKFTCPRHNCNICTNRTIRCCVKCTNSFCPSHSEGNVRHDKFLGFVCRLHDPGISPIKMTPETVGEQSTANVQRRKGFSTNKTSKNKGIYSYPPEKQEALRATWRRNKRREYDRKKLMKINLINKRRQSSSDNGAEICKALLKSTKKNISRQQNDKAAFQAEKSKNLTMSLKKYLKKVNPATWRVAKRQSKLEEKSKLGETLKIQNIYTSTQPNVENIQGDNVTTEQENAAVSVEQNTASNDEQHEKTNVTGDAAETTLNSALTNSMTEDETEAMEENDENIQNNLVTSENHGNSNDISDVTESARSEFEPFKSTKRRRQKPEPTDESIVSSTTSDEDSNSRAPPSQKVKQKETTANTELERDDLVSSTPPKEPATVLEPKELQEDDVDISEDEISLEQRVKRRSGVRNPRKKIRINVKSLISTAKKTS